MFFFVTNDDKVYAFGFNNYGLLGFVHNNIVNELKFNTELSYKQLIDFKNGFNHVIARSLDGKICCWGQNLWSVFVGNNKQDLNYYKPKLNQYLNGTLIEDMSCGANHTLVLISEKKIMCTKML